MKKVLIVAFLALVMIACKPDECTKETYMRQIEPLYKRWSTLATEVSQGGNSPKTMAEFTNTLDEIVNLKPPVCTESAHAAMVAHVSFSRQGFLAHWNGDNEKAIALFTQSINALDEWELLIGEIE